MTRVLFVFAGAFNGEEDIDMDKLRGYGIKTEFLGRVGLVYNLPKMSLESLRLALEDSPLLAKYLELFEDTKKKQVMDALMPAVTSAYEKNTLGIRLINTLLHQYFVNGGKLEVKEAKRTAFQTKLSLNS